MGINKYFDIGQPLWAEGNAYAGSAQPWHGESKPVTVDTMDSTLCKEGTEWILTLHLPAAVVNKTVDPVTSDRLGEPRIVEERYENPDGSPIDFSLDLLGNRRDSGIHIGPFANPQAGINRIVVWDETQP